MSYWQFCIWLFQEVATTIGCAQNWAGYSTINLGTIEYMKGYSTRTGQVLR